MPAPGQYGAPDLPRKEGVRFNEAFMMHTSTSPQYGLIASLDVATRMMQHGQGQPLLQDAIEEGNHHEDMRELAKIRKEELESN